MYQSSRSNEVVHASTAIINGIANDGGLYTKTSWPKATFLASLEYMTYEEIAIEVLTYFLDDFTVEEIKEVVKEAYGSTHFTDQIVGLESLNDAFLLTLFHGPTFAFKDMALSMFSSLQILAKKKNNERRKTIILSATSGDTGSAVLNGFVNDSETEIIIFYPYKSVSLFQEKQMHSFVSPNRKVIAIDGNFDDCQNLIKTGFQKIKTKKTIFSSANSINIARIIPQVIYYFYAYKELLNKQVIKYGDLINFVVPTGNFGNILAGYYAYKIGLPVHKFVVASNDNNVLTSFFNTGMYDKRRAFIKTSSPSMDILISSNLERLLFDLSGHNPHTVKSYMSHLQEYGFYQFEDMSHPLFERFIAGYLNEEKALMTINEVFAKTKVLIDPHTAVAVGVRNQLIHKLGAYQTVILSTASPVKFLDAVFKGLGEKQKDSFSENVAFLNQKYNLKIDPRVLRIDEQIIHPIVWSKTEALANLEKLVGEIDV